MIDSESKPAVPVNADLERLAMVAASEDSQPTDIEREAEAAESAEVEQPIDGENIKRLAGAGIAGLAWVVSTVWGVDHPEDTKQKGAEKLAPCLEQGILPSWAVDLFGRYGAFCIFGVFLFMTGVSTYGIVQERKAEAEKAKTDKKPGQGPVDVDPYAGGDSGGSFSTSEG